MRLGVVQTLAKTFNQRPHIIQLPHCEELFVFIEAIATFAFKVEGNRFASLGSVIELIHELI